MPSLSLESLVAELERELPAQLEKEARDIGRVTRLMERYDATAEEWRMFEFWEEDKYTRNLVSTDDKSYSLMLLCWNKGQKSPVHDHAGSECWLRVLKGTAVEEQFQVDENASKNDPLTPKAAVHHDAGAVCFINDSIGLHSIRNASDTEVLVTLHCYSPPFDRCKAFLKGTCQGLECPVNFYSENGQKCCTE